MIKDKCYIYGSIHLLLPHLENVLDKVDVVLLEGFSTKNWRELVKKDPVTIVAILGMLLLLGGQKIILSLARIYYKAFHGFQFKGDMEYVKELAKERGKVFEIADSNFHDIYAVKKSIFVEIFKRVLNFNLFLVILPFVAIIFVSLLFIIIFIANGNFSWEHFIKIFLLEFQIVIESVIMLRSPTRLVVISFGVVNFLLLIASGNLFLDRTNDLRDSKVVERATELVNSGKTVLIVRGKMHVKGIVRELEKRGIYCKEIN